MRRYLWNALALKKGVSLSADITCTVVAITSALWQRRVLQRDAMVRCSAISALTQGARCGPTLVPVLQRKNSQTITSASYQTFQDDEPDLAYKLSFNMCQQPHEPGHARSSRTFWNKGTYLQPSPTLGMQRQSETRAGNFEGMHTQQKC